MLEQSTDMTAAATADQVGRIRVKSDGVEAYSAPGGTVRLHDKTGRQIALVGLPPQSTRFLSLKGLEHGTYKVELECLTGLVATALVEA
jgi:hypothetical protein